ncbi:21381_t:CDS:1, partial [Gigaspora rosea]
DNSFYALLNGAFILQYHEDFQTTTMRTSNSSISDASENSQNDNELKEINATAFNNFLNEIKKDYQDADSQLYTALNKFMKHYQAAKSQSTSRLTSFLYNLNGGADPTARIKSGSMIRVQVESVKRRKTKGSGRKRKLLAAPKNKENSDPQIIPSWKKRNNGKKEHNLTENVMKNRPN